MSKLCLTLLASCAVVTPALGDQLLDYGIEMEGGDVVAVYSSVAGTNQLDGFSVYQPFDVTDASGWSIDTVSLFGRHPGYSDVPNADIVLSIYAWGGSLDDIGPALATTTMSMPNLPDIFDPGEWVDFDFGGLVLGQGSYILGADPLNADTWALWHNGATGPEALVQRATDGFVFPQGTSLATRVNGSVVPAPASLALLGVGGLLAGRRRR